jgi:hypothetical protein
MPSKSRVLKFLGLCLALWLALGAVASATDMASAPAPPPDTGRAVKTDEHGATIDPNG